MTMIELKEDLKLKYYLNMHLNGTPDGDAILFEIINYLVLNNLQDKEIAYKNVKFSSKTLKYIFGEKFNNEEYKNSIIQNIKKLVECKDLDIVSKSFHVTDQGIHKFYKKIKNYN
jgi:hypothetical protein